MALLRVVGLNQQYYPQILWIILSTNSVKGRAKSNITICLLLGSVLVKMMSAIKNQKIFYYKLLKIEKTLRKASF